MPAIAGRNVHAIRDARVRAATYIVVDQCSALSRNDLASFEACISAVHACFGSGDRRLPFAGANIVLVGDLHQLHPASSRSDPLYSRAVASPASATGREVFKRFSTIVTLPSLRNNEWSCLLGRLRQGRFTRKDADFLKSLVLDSKPAGQHDWHSDGWDIAPMLATRTAVVDAWNAAALRRHRSVTGSVHYLCNAIDLVEGRPATYEEKVCLEHQVLQATRGGSQVEIGTGMRVLVKTPYGRTLGIITSITMDAASSDVLVDGEALLRRPSHPPTAVVCSTLGGDTVTVVHTSTTFVCADEDGRRIRFVRKQFALQPAYAMLLQEAEGFSFEKVFLDLASPPTGSVSYADVYCGLSKVKDAGSVSLLRRITITLKPPTDLAAHDVDMDARTI